MAESNRTKMRLQWRLHKLIWSLSGGRLGRRAVGMPVLELVTIGRRSGEERSILITYVEDGGRPALIATNAGRDRDPAWVLNLRSNPRARARWDGEWREVTAVEVSGDDYTRLWDAAVEANPGYAEYLAGMSRSVPIVELLET